MEDTKTKKITIGIIAHVDSGKTTLSEALLYLSGRLRSFGRVDKGASFLDNNEMERERGITIFSKQARFEYGNTSFVLIDTPGHADFSAETERTLKVLDYAVLLIGADDGIKGQTKILWKLLSEYQVPSFIFFNKMDRDGADKNTLLHAMRELAGDSAVDFTGIAQA
ncbi:MAG: GTP-binding protein, partial [Lachnospiraceae bacterium]|nr:GTP-binding protein [Lachnospiraceae bacterium]